MTVNICSLVPSNKAVLAEVAQFDTVDPTITQAWYFGIRVRGE